MDFLNLYMNIKSITLDIIKYQSLINMYNYLPKDKKIELRGKYEFWYNEMTRLKKIIEDDV
jgi:hypothetical protein